MDERNCAKEYEGIEGSVSRDNIHVEMVMQEELFLRPSITATSMKFENILGKHHWVSLLLYSATFSISFVLLPWLQTHFLLS